MPRVYFGDQYWWDWTKQVVGGKAGWQVHLSDAQSDIFDVLFACRPKRVPTWDLINKVYSVDGMPEYPDTTLRVQIHILRKKLALTGLRITCHFGFGYTLECCHDPNAYHDFVHGPVCELRVADECLVSYQFEMFADLSALGAPVQ